MIVYRVENEKGEGPYHSEDRDRWGDFGYCPLLEEELQRHGLKNGRPNPSAHPLGNKKEVFHSLINRGGVFGFSSLDQLKNWFDDGTRVMLEDHGFWVTSYEVDIECCLSLTNQVIFLPPSKTLMIEYPTKI